MHVYKGCTLIQEIPSILSCPELLKVYIAYLDLVTSSGLMRYMPSLGHLHWNMHIIHDNHLFKCTLNKDFTIHIKETLNRLQCWFLYTLNWAFRLPADFTTGLQTLIPAFRLIFSGGFSGKYKYKSYQRHFIHRFYFFCHPYDTLSWYECCDFDTFF